MKIVVAGDYCPREQIAQMIENRDYTFLDGVRDVINSADYSIVNLECPIVDGNVQQINKCGPALRTVNRVVDSIKYAGFDCVTLANNHFRDFGEEGCLNTLDELKRQNVDYVGGGENLFDAQKILYKDIGDETLAVLNFCENEYSIASTTRAGAAPLDFIENYHQIVEARKNADYVLVIVHGGHEYYSLPSPRMKKLYRYFIDLGADAVINHHQHCYSGFEYYNDKPIVYGLGNFCFYYQNKHDSIWNEGYCVEIEFSKKQAQISLYPYLQCNNSPTISLMVNQQRDDFFRKIKELNHIIGDDILLNTSFEQWVESRNKYVTSIFASYHNRYLDAASRRGLIPFPLFKKELVKILNYIECESHRDVTIAVFRDKMSKMK